MNALLVVGTDTDAGKTVLTSALAAYWQTYCVPRRLGLMKPIQSGGLAGDTGRSRDDARSYIGDDRALYAHLFDLGQSLEEINPLYFEAPLAPPIAAELEGRKIKLDGVWRAFESLCQQRDWVLVEALGGLGSPVTRETTVADLAWDWRIPVVLVVPVRLGAIAQAVANAALARQAKVHLKGIVLNCVHPCSDQEIANWAPVDLIQSLTQKPVLGCIPHLTDPTDLTKLAQVASNLDLERLMPLPF